MKGVITLQEWNVAAEWTAGMYVLILIVYSRKNLTGSTFKEQMFLWSLCSVLLTITLNISSCYLVYGYDSLPMWFIDGVLTLYYICLPLASVGCFYYSACLIFPLRPTQRLSKRWFLGLIPYAVYIVIILLNYAFHNVFLVTPEEGYIQKTLFQLPYYIGFLYSGAIIVLAFINRKNMHKDVIKIIYVFPLFSLVISGVQAFNSDIILSGTAMYSAVLVIHIYLQTLQRTTDKLTGTLNRETLIGVLNKKIQNEKPFSLVMFSIKNFKAINARMGLEFGDELLEEMADYLKCKLQKENIYRYSGDQFAIISDHYDEKRKKLLDEIFERFKNPWAIRGGEITVNTIRAKIDYPQFGENVKDLMSSIDYSLAKLKAYNGEDTYLHGNAIYLEICRKNEITARLKDAVLHDGIEVYYQPIYAAKSGTFTQAEALMRLSNNTVNPIYPSEFIPVAEDTGLIIHLTYIMLDKVCAHMRKILDAKLDNVNLEAISVNVPYIQFLQEDMVSRFEEIIDKYHLPYKHIRIEITERTLVADPDTVKRVMIEMQNKGFVFELDDFGVDYANMSLFMQLPIDIVKLDRSLILTSVTSEKNKSFFQCLVKGFNALGTTIIAEGIEDRATLDYIIDCGCDCIQGFVFSKPLPCNEFIRFLAEYKDS